MHFFTSFLLALQVIAFQLPMAIETDLLLHNLEQVSFTNHEKFFKISNQKLGTQLYRDRKSTEGR